MPYLKWHQKAIKPVKNVTEKQLYIHTAIFGFVLFFATYYYTTWQKIPNALNKSVADVSILLIGLSMLLSSICYFWNFLDSKIIYRKHLGLIGFAFGLAHIGLSFSALQQLTVPEKMWPPLTGLLAAVIFLVMTLISNKYAATQLGGKIWRGILRTGYIGIIFVWAHVVLLKSARWITWYEGGMKTPPSMSLIVSIFMLFVILMRIALWWSLKRKARALPKT